MIMILLNLLPAAYIASLYLDRASADTWLMVAIGQYFASLLWWHVYNLADRRANGWMEVAKELRERK